MQQWTKWEPIPKLSKKYSIKSVTNTVNYFKIVLQSLQSDEKVEIKFKDGVDAYTRIDESFRQKSVHELYEKYGTNFCGDWTFFKVDNSKYISWLFEESYGWSNTRNFIHFSIVASDSIIDIISTDEPIVKFVNKKAK